MVTIAKMVQAAKAAQIQAHLAQLVPALLESLSGMEVGCKSISMRLLQSHGPTLDDRMISVSRKSCTRVQAILKTAEMPRY